MIRVAVIGSGGVAEAMAQALARAEGVSLSGVVGRNAERVGAIAEMSGCEGYALDGLPLAELYILAVSDGAVGELAEGLNYPKESIIAHTAGSVSMDGVDGVLYPMQSFTPGRAVDFRSVPIFIEGADERIGAVARALSGSVVEMSSAQRIKLHLAAVFASNFVNAMFTATSDLLAQNSLDISLYRPLIGETIAKVFDEGISPRKAQTGPAKRGDEVTQARHETLLEGEMLDMYKIISRYIWETSRRT